MKKKVVGIGQYLVTDSPDEFLCTFALGSCVALTLYFPAGQIAGMTHVALPDSLLTHTDNGKKGTAYFADQAVPALLGAMKDAAAKKNFISTHGMTAKLIGGATVIKIKNDFQIGKRIVRAIETQLAYHRIPISAHDVGGTISRTVTMQPTDGKILIRTPGKPPRTL